MNFSTNLVTCIQLLSMLVCMEFLLHILGHYLTYSLGLKPPLHVVFSQNYNDERECIPASL